MGREPRDEKRPADAAPDEASQTTDDTQQTTDSESQATASTKRRSETVRQRKARVPLGRHRARMSVDPHLIPEGKVARWVNDKPGRLQQAEAGGYAFVDDPYAEVGEDPAGRRDRLSTKVRCVAGTNDDGSTLYAYLMVIDKDLYDEDQRGKQGQVDEIDRAIQEGGIEGQVGVDGRYIPDKGQGISIQTVKGS